jgi:polyisoprenoid-binding protein YceI
MRALSLAVTLACLSGPAWAATTTALAPPQTQIRFTLYAFGMLPITGTFQQFQGTTTIDAGPPARCQVHIALNTASLRMPVPSWTSRALSPEMLNAQTYPTAQFNGSCAPDEAQGSLTLHGVTRSFALRAHQTGTTLTATGHLNRRDFGITGLPMLLSQDIRITVTVPVGGR